VTGQVGVLVVPTWGWQAMFLIGAIPGLVIAGLLLRLHESPRWLIGRGRLQEAEAIIARIEASADKHEGTKVTEDTKTSTPSHPDTQAEPRDHRALRGPVERTRWTELLSPVYRGRTAVVWTLWACAYFITNGLNNWMPTLYNRIYGLSLDQSLRAGTLNNVAQVAILLACAFVIDRTGRRRWMTVCFTAGAILLAALGSFASGSVTAVIVLVTLSYGIVGSVNAVLYLYTPEIYPTRMRALGTGAATCWLRLASAAAPVLVGHLVESSTGAVFLMFAGAGVIGAAASALILETRNRRLEDIAP